MNFQYTQFDEGLPRYLNPLCRRGGAATRTERAQDIGTWLHRALARLRAQLAQDLEVYHDEI